MAWGVSEAFPKAMLIYVNGRDDLKLHHLEHREWVLLVDSVVNSGKKIVEFVKRIHILHTTILILVVTGVVRKVTITGPFEFLDGYVGLTRATLRVSENKFTG